MNIINDLLDTNYLLNAKIQRNETKIKDELYKIVAEVISSDDVFLTYENRFYTWLKTYNKNIAKAINIIQNASNDYHNYVNLEMDIIECDNLGISYSTIIVPINLIKQISKYF